tara:strand:+ start:294 stop:539 length:246 start_codon:yes stop_codon:yes gene_type:complete
MKKIRKVNINKRKLARKALAEATSLMLDHPTECVLCKKTFERTPITVKEWTVTVQEKRVHLTCPSCTGVVKGVVEEQNNGI